MSSATAEARPYVLPAPTRGVQTRKSESVVLAGTYQILRNVEYAQDVGVFKPRQGSEQFNTSSLGATPIRGMFRWKGNTYFGHGTQLWRLAATPVSIGSGFTSDKEWFFAASFSYLYACNGTNPLQRHDGATTRAAGFTAPSSGPTASIVAVAGVMNGTYKYKYSFIYSSSDLSEESSVSPDPAGSASPVNQQVDLSSFQAAPTGAVWMNIFRTKAGGTQFFFHSKVAVNPGGPIRDNVADNLLGLTQGPTDNAKPPTAKYMLFLNGRMWYAEAGSQPRLWYSARASTERNPVGTLTLHGAHVEIVPGTFYVDVGQNYEPITGLSVWGDSIVVFKETEIWIIRGDNPGEFRLIDTSNAVGCVAARSIVNMGLDQGIFFLGKGDTGPAVYAFGGGRAMLKSLEVEPTFRANLVGIGAAYTVQPAAGRYRRQYVLSYAKSATPTYEYAVYDCSEGRWRFDDGVEAACWLPYNEPGDAGELYFGHAKAGWVVRYDYRGPDFSSAAPSVPVNIPMVIETDWLDLGHAHRIKQLDNIWLRGMSHVDATITVERRFDYLSSGTSQDCSAAVMGAAITGSGVFFKQIHCGAQSTDGIVAEQGYYVKLIITITVAYNGVAGNYKRVQLNDIVIEYSLFEPMSGN